LRGLYKTDSVVKELSRGGKEKKPELTEEENFISKKTRGSRKVGEKGSQASTNICNKSVE